MDLFNKYLVFNIVLINYINQTLYIAVNSGYIFKIIPYIQILLL